MYKVTLTDYRLSTYQALAANKRVQTWAFALPMCAYVLVGFVLGFLSYTRGSADEDVVSMTSVIIIMIVIKR